MLHPRLLEEYESFNPEAQPIGIYVLDRDGALVAVNDEACRLLRQPRAELVGTKIVRFYRNPGHRGVFMDKLRKGAEHSFVLDFSVGGQQAYLLDQARLILDGSEEIGVLGFLSDITDKEQALRLVERVPTGVYIADADGVLRYANSGLAEMLGVGTRCDLIGRPVGDFYAEKDELGAFTARLSVALREGREEAEEKILLVRGGKTRFPALVKAFPFEGPDGRVPWREGIVTDISKLVEYEHYLVSLPGFYRLETDAGGVFRVEMCSNYFAKLFGFKSPEEMKGYATKELVNDPEAFKKFEWKVAQSSEPVFDHRLHVHNKDHTRSFYIAINALALRDENCQPVGRIGFVYEVTERVELERQLVKFRSDTGRLLHGFSNTLVRLRTAVPPARMLVPQEMRSKSREDLVHEIQRATAELASSVQGFVQQASQSGWSADELEELRRLANVLEHREEVVRSPALRPSSYRKFAEKVLDAAERLAVPSGREQALQVLQTKCRAVLEPGNLLNLGEHLVLCEFMDAAIRLFRRRLAFSRDEKEMLVVVRNLLDVVISEWSEFASSCSVIIRPKGIPEGRILCREHDMVVALGNLLHNAIKYSWSPRYAASEEKRESYRYVELDGTGSTEAEFVLRITNLGVPIASDEIGDKLVFKPGFRGRHSGTRGRIGSGLGLSYAADVIEGAKGSIEVESVPAVRGADPEDYDQPFLTSFTVRLPFRKEAQ
ncbi:MAG: PAS domain-containing protein [candidate division WOR-3 bacterium]|nr:PAS domain-containing protein [candidate division WOR-3 bacterium]